ncbi:hypothetical protein [Antarctobacter heliothermus]|jgi:hypothetical protein|uniref:Uncharacterized protein n=1 Tax=Antarctobacter heliothermus TaxID=74033 RepID=A0A239EJZ6_9RHOB|nr:hypothetical protein [Antarctobacter heliothermus]SNS44721.1 hypothetical protein SAMN04488078_101562 [Antarctobacter heliothermus]
MKADKMDEYWRIQWGIAVANDRGDVGRELELLARQEQLRVELGMGGA